MEAWQFTRTFNEKDAMRARLFKQILEYSVTRKPLASLKVPLSQYNFPFQHTPDLQL
jgi:hypothetical protein